jgi:hypothetical protein
MKYIKTFEDNDFDPNNFNKLVRDIKGITIELKDNEFRITSFEHETDIGFDNYDFYIRMSLKPTSWSNLGIGVFTISDVKDYIYTIMDYVDIYYEYDDFYIKLNAPYGGTYKLNEPAYVYFESNLNKKVSYIELCFKDIIKKK